MNLRRRSIHEVPALGIDHVQRAAARSSGGPALVHPCRKRAPEKASAGIPNARGIFTGCYLIGTGDVRLIRGSLGCRPGERRVTWSRRGPIGPRGLQGAVGVQGATGERGETGAQGSQGSAGPSGPGGPPGAVGPAGTVGGYTYTLSTANQTNRVAVASYPSAGDAWAARVRVHQNLGGGVTISLSVYAVCTV